MVCRWACGSNQQNWNSIPEQLPVARNQNQPLNDRLRDKQAIERVSVVKGKIPDRFSVADGHRQLRHSMGVDKIGDRSKQSQRAKRLFDAQLPGRHRTQENLRRGFDPKHHRSC